ncbi:recombination protein NinB [Acidovorax sp. SUPP1855]|uniref:recombination protein NinB n=1 Tax=Acidovorax sp. SUPP1855 TaxID=431774 RepID=UPI0023DE3E95|nr:recombination protein NinB [Acidovorax sp. SUPP1855]GKS86494.1 recombination protein NinB [Acidovorax sp. SUPP1855]
MSDRITLSMWEPVQAHKALMHAWMHAKALLMAGHRLVLEVRPETRSDAQNRRLWAMLRDISQQVDWYGQRLTDEEWKDVFSASLKRQKAVPGLDGGFVICGQRTSKMTRGEMAELQELIAAFGAEKGVQFKAEGEYAH